MKKCKYCEAEYEGSVCPMCGYDDSSESAEITTPQATASAEAPEAAGAPSAEETFRGTKAPAESAQDETAHVSETAPPQNGTPAAGYQQGGYTLPYGYPPQRQYQSQYPPCYGYAADIPSPQKKKYTAGSSFLALAKAAGHIGFYFAVMIGVAAAISSAASAVVTILSDGNMSQDVFSNFLTGLLTPINIFAGGTLIACLALFFLILKRNAAAEMGLNPTRWRYILYAAALGVAFQFIVTFTISLIPTVAEYYSKAFDEQYAAMMQAPLSLEIINVAIMTPFVEEILFRGMIYGSLRKGMSKVAAAIIASVIFGVFHGNIVSMIYAAALSFIMIAVYEKTGSLFVTVAMHAALNGSSFIMGYIPESPVIILAVYVLSIAVGVSAFMLLMHAGKRSEEYTTQESMVR